MQFSNWLDERDRSGLLDASSNDIRAYLQWAHSDGGEGGDGLHGTTVEHYQVALIRFYEEFTDDENPVMVDVPDGRLYDDNPARFDLDRYVDASSMSRKQKYAENDEGIIYLTPEETRKLRENVQKPKVRNELLIKMFVQTGARASELSNLTLEQLDRDERVVHIDDTKNDQTRSVPYTDLSPELELWLDGNYRDRFAVAENSEYLFVSRRSEQLTASRMSDIVREGAKRAEIQDKIGTDGNGNTRWRVTPHVLRATCIMRLFEGGMSLPKVKKITGHSNVETLQSYIRAGEEDVKKEYHNTEFTFEN